MKYNWSIIGHEKQLKQLELDIESNNLSHAYLLVGSDSIGKYTVAKKMAGILQCENNFCHTCPTCIQVINGSHIDTIELKDNKESLKIDEIRGLILRLSMSKQGRYKIAMIENIERMTLEAANSFLKILEEPPNNTIFIMTTNRLLSLLDTIVSRVRIIKFDNAPINYLTEQLERLYPKKDKEEIRQVCLFSLGKTGRAVYLMENPEIMANYLKIYHDIQNYLERKNIADRFAYVEEIFSDEAKIEVFFEILTHVLRTKLLSSGGSEEKYINLLSKIDEAGILLKKNVNAKLVLENLMLAL